MFVYVQFSDVNECQKTFEVKVCSGKILRCESRLNYFLLHGHLVTMKFKLNKRLLFMGPPFVEKEAVYKLNFLSLEKEIVQTLSI